MKHLLYIVLLFLCFVSLQSCEDFLEVPAPKDQIDIGKVFNDDRLAVSALMQVYTDVRTTGFLSGAQNGIGFLMGNYTDELEATTTQMPDFRVFYQGNVTSTNNAVNQIWRATYKQIYMLNNIIEGVENSQGVTTVVKKQIQGEAFALRGILHFYLTQTYGEVPYVNTTDYILNSKISKITTEAAMDLAIADLLLAEEFLSQGTGAASFEKVRISALAVQAFLARMYLYQQNWERAQFYANQVIGQMDLSATALANVFLKGSTSAIWQLKPDTEGRNTIEADSYIFVSEPAPQAKLSTSLYTSFEGNDLRKQFWVKQVGSSAHANKYKQRGFTPSTLEYSIIIRLEEMYLIGAEAAAEMEDLLTCQMLLNTLRDRAGLLGITITNKPMAIGYILQERRVELFCEFGHRFYDLKRKGMLNQLTQTKANWQTHFELLPLPDAELLLNANLKPQNFGY